MGPEYGGGDLVTKVQGAMAVWLLFCIALFLTFIGMRLDSVDDHIQDLGKMPPGVSSSQEVAR